MSDRHGRKRPLLLGIALYGVTSVGSMQFTLATLRGAAAGLFAVHSAVPLAAVFLLFAGLALTANRSLAPR